MAGVGGWGGGRVQRPDCSFLTLSMLTVVPGRDQQTQPTNPKVGSRSKSSWKHLSNKLKLVSSLQAVSERCEVHICLWIPKRRDRVSQEVLLVKNLSAKAGTIRDSGSIPGSGRSPGEGHGNPLQYSCLEKPMDRGPCWATFQGATKNWTWLKRLSTHAKDASPVYLILKQDDDVTGSKWMRKEHLLRTQAFDEKQTLVDPDSGSLNLSSSSIKWR